MNENLLRIDQERGLDVSEYEKTQVELNNELSNVQEKMEQLDKLSLKDLEEI